MAIARRIRDDESFTVLPFNDTARCKQAVFAANRKVFLHWHSLSHASVGIALPPSLNISCRIKKLNLTSTTLPAAVAPQHGRSPSNPICNPLHLKFARSCAQRLWRAGTHISAARSPYRHVPALVLQKHGLLCSTRKHKRNPNSLIVPNGTPPQITRCSRCDRSAPDCAAAAHWSCAALQRRTKT